MKSCVELANASIYAHIRNMTMRIKYDENLKKIGDIFSKLIAKGGNVIFNEILVDLCMSCLQDGLRILR